VADERSNAVVVSAPEDQMPLIEELVAKIDTPVDEITELRVFRLKFADPQETADLLTSLFPDTTTSQQGNRGQFRFGGGRFGGGFGGNAAGTLSERAQKQTRVVAVPDLRTGSVVVSASHDLMEQIDQMLNQLDSDPAKKMKVFVFDLQNTDPQTVQEELQSLFPSPSSGSNASSRNTSRQAGSQLNNRATQSQSQSQGINRNSGFGGGTSGLGSGGTTGR
jgi:type II secretory pathway component GspD/PulD (secretin)